MTRTDFIPPRPVAGNADTSLRAGLASFIIHVVLICLLLGSGLYYGKLSTLLPPEKSVVPPATVLRLIPVAPPDMPLEPVPSVVPIAPAPSVPLPANTADAKKQAAALKAKIAHKKLDGTVTHHRHKLPARALPSVPLPPIAKAVQPKEPPRALPVGKQPTQAPIVSVKTPLKVPAKAMPVLAAPPPPPIAQPIPTKNPPRALPVTPQSPAVAAIISPKPSRAAQVTAPKPVVIPVLPAMPPPRALPVPVAQPVPVPAIVALPAPPTPPAPPAPPAKPLDVAFPHTIEPPAPPAPPAAESAATASSPDSGPNVSTLFHAVGGVVLLRSPGEAHLTAPNYPPEAKDHHETGTVMIKVLYDPSGQVISVEVAESSGYRILDSSAKDFALSHWQSPALGGETVMVPVKYQLR